jgi:hypothetical protein
VGAAVRDGFDDPALLLNELEASMVVFLGLDVHRAQITFDALDAASGEVQTGQVRPANRETFRRFLAPL